MNETIKIIIADENKETTNEFLQNLPEDKFNLLAVANDGATLLELIKTHKPDVVVMDLILPQLDGFAVMERLNKEGINTNIIVHTSLSLNGFVNKAINLGAKYYAIKPFNANVLINRIEDIVAGVELQGKETASSKMGKMEEKITNIFITVGIPAHIKGYQFLREAIKLAIK